MTIDACIKDFICARTTCAGVEVVQPKSRLWYDDLPGISTAGIAKIEPGKYGSAAKMMEEKLRIAGEKVLDLALDEIEPYVKEGFVLEAGEIGVLGTEYGTASAFERGIRVKMEGGILHRLLIPSVYIQGESAVTDLEVLVRDGDTEHTFEVDLKEKTLTEIPIHLLAENKVVDIVIEDSRFKPILIDTSLTRYFGSCTTCAHGTKYERLAGVGIVKGEEGTEGFGIAAKVIATCSIDGVMCMVLRKLRWAVLYQWGVEVMDEHVATGRMNYLAIHGKEWAAEQALKYRSGVRSQLKKHARGLKSFIANLTPECVSCGTGVTLGYAHP